MEALLCLGCGACAALAAWVLTCGDEGAIQRPGDTGTRRALVRALREVGLSAPMRTLERLGLARGVVDELVLSERVQAAGLAREGARGLLVAYVGACGLLGLVVALSLLGTFAGVAVGCVAAAMWRSSRVRGRKRDLARQVPDAFRSLAGALAAGRTLPQAISYVGSMGTGPLNREFARASLLDSCGTPAADAIEQISARTDAPGVELMVCALTVSARTGAPLQGLFLRSAQLVERRFALERELEAKTAQVRLSAKIVSGLPVCLVALLVLTSPDFRAGLATPVGLGCVLAAALLDVVALAIIARLMRGVL